LKKYHHESWKQVLTRIIGRPLNCVISYVLFLSLILSNSSLAQEDSSLTGVLTRAYTLLRGDSPKALPLFEQAVQMDPGNVAAHRQLGYLYIDKKRYDQALQHFLIADSLMSSDTTRLQIAYTLVSMNRQEDATKLLEPLLASPSEEIRTGARYQLALLPSSPLFARWWTRIYLAPFYDTRWNTSFYFANLQEGYFLLENKKLSGYGFILASGDARSKGGLAPTLFSDNAVITGLGVQAKPLTGLQIEVQQGIAFDILKSGTRSRTRGDFRAIGVYNWGIAPEFTLHPNVKFLFSTFIDLYSSAGYYSRYDNGIGYLQARIGTRVSEVSYTALDLYVKGNFAGDTKKEFFNNFIDGGVGARFIPDIRWGLYLIGEYQRGMYIDRGGSINPYGKYYDGYRFFLIFDRVF
jgi:hypothetical protein